MKNIFVFLLIVTHLCLLQAAQAQVSVVKSKPMLTFNHIALHVHDLQQSATFYEQVMQLNKIDDPFNDGLHAWFSIGDPLQLHLIQGAPKEIQQDIKRHLCFSVSSLDDFMTLLSRHKIRYYNNVGEPDIVTVRPDGIKQLYIQDPDGYWLEINNESQQ